MKSALAVLCCLSLLAICLPAQELSTLSKGNQMVSATCQQLDITEVVNRGFVDNAEGKGGWLNLGADALQGIKPGTLAVKGVNFAIIDPALNSNKSVLVMSQKNSLFPEPLTSANIPVNAMADRLYLLHTYARTGPGGFDAAVEWHYVDGTLRNDKIEIGVHMSSTWYRHPVSADRALPVKVDNKGNSINPVIGLYAASIINPCPEKKVKELRLIASGDCCWCVFALSVSQGANDLLGFDQPAEPARITVNTRQTSGKIRRLHGNNLAPSTRRMSLPVYDHTAEMTMLEIPLIRLHDVPLQTPMPLIDIPYIFPLFHQNADDPRNYVFAQTDDYIANALKTGGKIMYRLGVSIEHSVNHYNTNPPEDYDKWAEICCRIIQHYNEGWANGFHHGIEYWEIWNEPNVGPKMWTGSWDDYIRLYVTAAKKIKARFPNIKVGGPSLAGDPPSLIRPLLEECRKKNAPLDFFSWHNYSVHPQGVYDTSYAIRRLMDEYGFSHTELHLNEWHYNPQVNGYNDREVFKAKDAAMNGIDSAAFTTAVLSGFQDTPVTMAYFYTLIDSHGAYRLFHSITNHPEKKYYALLAFNRITKYEDRLAVETEGSDNIWVLAGAKSDGSCAALISCFRDAKDGRDLEIAFVGKTLRKDRCRISILNETHDLVATDDFTVKGDTVFLKNREFSAVYLLEILD